MEMTTRGASATPPSAAHATSKAPNTSSRRSPKRRRSAGVEGVKTGRERDESPPPGEDQHASASKRRKETEDAPNDKQDAPKGKPDTDIPVAEREAPSTAQRVVLSAQTMREMDAFMARGAQWQAQLASLAQFLAAQVARVEQEQVAATLRDSVTRVEFSDREARVTDAEMEQRWRELSQQDADAFATALTRSRTDAQEFEAMERQLVADRVLELETQLQQKRASEKDKERELATLRAEHDALLRSSAEAETAKSDADGLIAERDALRAKLLEVKTKYKLRAEQTARLKDEVLNYKFQYEDLLDECRALRDANESMKRENESQNRELDAVKEQLEAERETRKSEEQADKRRIQAEAEDSRRRVELLAAELQRVQSALYEAVGDAEAKTSEVSLLQAANAELKRRLTAAAAECEALAKDCHEVNGIGATSGHTRSSPSPSPSKKRRREEPPPPSMDRSAASSMASETAMKRQAEEKELLQEFFRRYYRAAERKCGALKQQVSQLEQQTAAHSQRARESLDALRACAQATTWDDEARETLLAVVNSLERSES